jgi:hypothetical protein
MTVVVTGGQLSRVGAEERPMIRQNGPRPLIPEDLQAIAIRTA